MDKFLPRILEAHGGIDHWERLTRLTARMSRIMRSYMSGEDHLVTDTKGSWARSRRRIVRAFVSG